MDRPRLRYIPGRQWRPGAFGKEKESFSKCDWRQRVYYPRFAANGDHTQGNRHWPAKQPGRPACERIQPSPEGEGRLAHHPGRRETSETFREEVETGRFLLLSSPAAGPATTGGASRRMRATPPTSAMSTRTGTRTTTMRPIPMGSPRIFCIYRSQDMTSEKRSMFFPHEILSPFLSSHSSSCLRFIIMKLSQDKWSV